MEWCNRAGYLRVCGGGISLLQKTEQSFLNHLPSPVTCWKAGLYCWLPPAGTTRVPLRAAAALHAKADVQLHGAHAHGAVSRFWPWTGMCPGIEAFLLVVVASGCAAHDAGTGGV